MATSTDYESLAERAYSHAKLVKLGRQRGPKVTRMAAHEDFE